MIKSSSTPAPVSWIESGRPHQWQPGPLSSPSIMPFDIGSEIRDHSRGYTYTLLEPLGNGSYAVVYKVRNMQTNKLYALKCLSRANLAPHHLAIQRNEAILHQRLSTGNVAHRNLVMLHFTFETPDWLFLVLEYCEGQDLYYWLTQSHDSCDPKTGRELSERQRIQLVKNIFLQILDVVGYCHANGIAHRDLKPENFIVMSKENGDVQVKLTDFGLATDEEESADFDCGSKPYMSYECCNQVRDTYSPRLADMWSLGIVFLNLLYHRSPWTDPSPRACKAFAEFQRDKTGFLMHRFDSMPREVALFLGNRVFCGEEEGRVSVEEWKAWCNSIVDRLWEGDCEEKSKNPSNAIVLSSSNTWDTTPSSEWTPTRRDRKQSWSDVIDEFGFEMDFSEPLIFNDNKDDDGDDDRDEEEEDDEDDDDDDDDDCEDDNEDVNTNNDNGDVVQRSFQPYEDAPTETKPENDVKDDVSDADSGFGSDRDSIGHKIRESPNERERNQVQLSHSPPKVIYCKLRPWGEQRPRGRQREGGLDGYANNSMTNNHWSSYHQRRERLERLEQRRDKEAGMDRWIQQHRQEAPVDSSKALDGGKDGSAIASTTIATAPAASPAPAPAVTGNNCYPRRARVRSLHQASRDLFGAQSRDAPRTGDHFVVPPRSKHNQARYGETNSAHANARGRFLDDPLRIHPGKRPQKVTRSTKYSLGKMLEKMVVFNRGIKVGGHAVNA